MKIKGSSYNPIYNDLNEVGHKIDLVSSKVDNYLLKLL